MKTFKFTINGNQYNVDVKDIEDNIAHLEVNGTKYEIEIEKSFKKTKTPTIVRSVSTVPPKPDIDKHEKGSATPVLAPLPGNIIEIFSKTRRYCQKRPEINDYGSHENGKTKFWLIKMVLLKQLKWR
jgi:biotin carboxyl carrier protein